jgi:hypothetical protein
MSVVILILRSFFQIQKEFFKSNSIDSLTTFDIKENSFSLISLIVVRCEILYFEQLFQKKKKNNRCNLFRNKFFKKKKKEKKKNNYY